MGFLHLPSKIFKNMAFFLLVKVAIWPSGLMDTLDIFVQQIRLTAETGTFGEGLIGTDDWKVDPPLEDQSHLRIHLRQHGSTSLTTSLGFASWILVETSWCSAKIVHLGPLRRAACCIRETPKGSKVSGETCEEQIEELKEERGVE